MVLYLNPSDNLPSTQRTLEGHVDEATVCKFFPSGVVVITGGVDMRLKIWSAETGDNPVTMTGHAGAITDVAIIDKGRNVLSTSRYENKSLKSTYD
jgi:proteasomal ATPase-associated factor 1